MAAPRRARRSDRVGVVHGDAGPGNFVHADGRVVAVTDWEFAHLGDPAEDWSFCLTMRGCRTHATGDLARPVRHPRRRVALTDEELALLGGVQPVQGCLRQPHLPAPVRAGGNPAPNMAIIGTVLHQLFLRRLVDIVHG